MRAIPFGGLKRPAMAIRVPMIAFLRCRNESNPLRGIDLTPWAPFPAREGENPGGGQCPPRAGEGLGERLKPLWGLKLLEGHIYSWG